MLQIQLALVATATLLGISPPLSTSMEYLPSVCVQVITLFDCITIIIVIIATIRNGDGDQPSFTILLKFLKEKISSKPKRAVGLPSYVIASHEVKA